VGPAIRQVFTVTATGPARELAPIARLVLKCSTTNQEIAMTLGSLSATQPASAQESYHPDKLRTSIGEYLGIDSKRVIDEAHFSDDLGIGWLDRLELMILIEDKFPGVEITNDDADQIQVVGDLIRHIQNNEQRLKKLGKF
jgi:acyl carrier protein